jgi:hypothetical protein
MHDGGGSQPEERQCLAAEVHRIVRHQKKGKEGFWINNFRTRYRLKSGDSINGLNYPLA